MYSIHQIRKNQIPSLLRNQEPFASFLDAVWKDWGETTISAFAPQLDVTETEKVFLVHVELPGVNKEDVDLSLKEGVLTIKGEKKQEAQEQKAGYSHSERSYGSFQRVLKLNEKIVEEEITADFKDGVLTITLPKSEKEPQKRIAIN